MTRVTYNAGTLQRTYVGHTMAHVDGTDPAYGTWSYYFHDHLGSTRRLRDASKTSVAGYEYMPYGQVYAASGTTTATTHTYAMLAWDDTAGMYFAPFRYYMPEAGRWTQRDPLGMVDGTNVFAYVGGNPTRYGDALGVCREDGESFSDCKARMMRISARVGHPFRGDAATCYGGRGRLLWSRPGSPKEGFPDMVG